jgi:Tol biopolymer transport system component
MAAAMTAALGVSLSALWFVYSPSAAPAAEEQAARGPGTTPSSTLPGEPESSAKTDSAIDRPGVPTTGLAAKPATTGFSPSFASVDSTLFYHSGTGPGSAIMRADTDERGTVVRVSSVVKDNASNFHARPSPDGQWLAFDSDRDGERGIYVADVNGQGVRRVSGPGFASVPSWSPDGRRIAFVRSEPRQPQVWNIWILNLATGESSRITSHRYGQPWGATWFPDGNRIAYSHEGRLIVRTLDGKDVRTFNSPIPGHLLRTPAVSPDGRQIIFQVHRDGAWMLDLASGSMSRVLKDPSAEEFTWSHDGEQLAYHSRLSGTWSVWVMAPRG